MTENLLNLGCLEGYLDIEDDNANAFRKRFFRLNRNRDVLEYYRENPISVSRQSSEDMLQPLGLIDIKYITNVVACSQKQRKDHCFEINTTGRKYLLAATSAADMHKWITALHKAAVNPSKGSRSNSESREEAGTKSNDNVTYQTKIVGGVVIKCPVQKSDSESEQSSSLGDRSGSGLRLIKDGWCFKQGAVMKNWKRRYFTLNVLKLCYYENKEEKEPLKTVSMQDVRGVRDVSGFSNRDNVFEIETPYRKFYVQTDTYQELQSWMAEIRSIITPPSCR